MTRLEAMGQGCDVQNISHEALTAYVTSGWTVLGSNWQGYVVASPTVDRPLQAHKVG